MQTMNPTRTGSHFRAALKHSALAVAMGAAVFFTTGPCAKANVNYDFSTGLQGWTQIYPTTGALWDADFGWPEATGSLGHLGKGWNDSETQMGRSPAFTLVGSADLTFQTHGSKSSLAAVDVTPSTVPATAIDLGGFCGLALRDVATDTYVLSKGQSEHSYGVFPTLSFTAAELAPYANDGKAYTLDWIDYDKDISSGNGDGWGWLVNVSIPGVLYYPANDNFADAINLPGTSGTQTGTNNLHATLEVGEPATVNYIPSGTSTFTNSVWFQWTCPEDGNLTVSTVGSTDTAPTPGEYDAVLGIYSGSAVDALTPLGVSPLDTFVPEAMTVAVTAGTTYHIQVAGYESAVAANILLNWSFVPAIRAEIEAFGPGATISSVVDNAATIDWTVPYGTPLATLTPSFTLSPDATCTVGGLPVVSAVTVVDFSGGPVEYTVTSLGGAIVNVYTVTVTWGPASSACDITAFGTNVAGSSAVITTTGFNTGTVVWTVPFGSALETLAPTYTLSASATCPQPNPGVPTPNFSAPPVPYLVTAQDGTTKTYNVAVKTFIFGDDFQLYKPGSTTVTATFTSGWGVVWSGASPTNMLVNADGSGVLTYSDSTTGTMADLLQWTKTRGGANILPNGPGGSHALNAFATWGGHTQVETTGSLYTVAADQTVTISVMVGGGVGGPMGSDLTFGLYADGVPIVPSSSVNVNPADSASFQMISRTYGPTALASHIGASTKIVLGAELTNPRGGAIIYDNVTLVSSVADATAPTLISFVDNKGGAPVLVNEPVTYTVTFSEPMSAMTVDAADFGNTGATAMTVNSVTPTADPAVFTVGVTPTEAGTLQLQVLLAATLTDLEGNALDTDPAISDDTSLLVQDLPPTPTSITVVSSGSPTTYGQNVTFTATVDPAPSSGTVQFWDGESYLGAPVAVDTITGEASVSTTALGATTHAITAEYSGNYAFAASTTAAPPLLQEVGQAQLTVKASDTIRPTNTANPDPLTYQITGYQNGENLATSGVSGTPLLTTDAVLESTVGSYVITCAQGSLAASNYSFTLVNGTLTVAEMVNTFSVNFYTSDGPVQIPTGVLAGLGDWSTSGWLNYDVPWSPSSPQAPVPLTSNIGSSATFTLIDTRNGGGAPSDTSLGGNYSMMGAMAHGTSVEGEQHKFDMNMANIPFATYDVIFYMGRSVSHGGDGTGAIVFNGAPERAFTVQSGAFVGTFTEMVDATTAGNYIVFKGVTGASFTAQVYGNGFNHLGVTGFQIREVVVATTYSTWALTNAPGQTPGDDYDNDGVENGLEYFMGETGSTFTAMPGLDGSNTVTWTKDPNYQGTWQVQTSPDLSAWTNVAGTDNGTSVSYTLPTGAGTLFVRLLVTPTP